jgi:hypothetical protein
VLLDASSTRLLPTLSDCAFPLAITALTPADATEIAIDAVADSLLSCRVARIVKKYDAGASVKLGILNINAFFEVDVTPATVPVLASVPMYRVQRYLMFAEVVNCEHDR